MVDPAPELLGAHARLGGLDANGDEQLFQRIYESTDAAAPSILTAPDLSTRLYLKDASLWQPVAQVHERYFGAVRPVNTLLQIGALVGDCEIEIEAEAEVGA